MKYIVVFISIILVHFVNAESRQNWSYRDSTAPQYWANISPLYLGCAEGNQQSPINIITKNVKTGAIHFELQYNVAKGVNLVLANNIFRIVYPQGNFLEMGGSRYQLKEIYFKTPGENSIDTMKGLMEAQFLHEDSKGNKVMLSVFFVEGRANPILDSVVKNLPTQPNQANFIANIDIYKLLPNNLASYQFDGSLTTPPCSQGVRWIILKQAMTLSQSQLVSMQNITKANARPIQELFNRLIVN